MRGEINEKKQFLNLKEFGLGTLSLIICILGIMFSFTYIGNAYIGDRILNTLNLKISRGIVSIILFFISIYLGNQYKENLGAKLGKNFSVFFIGVISLVTIISMVF